MPENQDQLKCPLCEGHGKVRRAKLIECLTNHALKSRIDAYVAEIVRPEDGLELAGVSTLNTPRNFQKEVHDWNPALPMWRRSPKE